MNLAMRNGCIICSNKITRVNYIDFFIAQTWISNSDVMDNVKFFKNDEGKWTWILYDIDLGFRKRYEDTVSSLLYQDGAHLLPTVLAISLLDNPDYREFFLTRFAWHLENIWNEENIIARVDEIDDSLLEEPVLTNEDFVVGIRPEFIDITDGNVEGEIYGAMPTGMESTIKIRLDDFLLTGVIFGSTLFTIGSKVKLNIKSDDILLFDRKSGKRIACGHLELHG